MKEMYHDTKVVHAISPADHTATVSSAAIDRLGYESIQVIVTIGATAIAAAGNSFAFTVTSGATNAAAGVVPTADYVFETDDIADLVIDDVAQALSTFSFSLRSRTAGQRWIKVVATETGAAQVIFGAVVVLGNPASLPTH